jgi:hypothetical protein
MAALTEDQRRADVARQLAAMAVCPKTRAFFQVLQQRWARKHAVNEFGQFHQTHAHTEAA